MWLIRVADHKLMDFVYERRPEYAILSHRWDDFNPEVGFQDMLDTEKASSMPKFNKILNACSQAAMDGIKFIWIDTCCINKESSAELTEAINSMYDWYKAAKVCYALLADVMDNADTEGILDQISSSEWFTRGWTLQELIAPDVVVFFNQSWQRLGTKLSLRASLTARTGINTAVLTGWEPPSSRSVAERMSWASQRKTTRVEDEAYCLLGIFGVNMPMLYGEGTRAFRRLQEEIMKVSDDQSIFAWPLPKGLATHQDLGTNSLTDSIEGRSNRVRQLFGLLADSPRAFKTCASISRKASRKGTPPYTMTNRGLSISLWAGVVEVDTYLVRLNCDDSSVAADKGNDDNCQLGIFLTCLDGDEQFARVADNEGRSIRRLSSELYDGFATLHFFIPQNRDFEPVETSNFDVLRPRVNGIRLKTPGSFDLYELVSSYKWDDQSHLLTQAAQPGLNRCHLAERGITLDLGEDTSTDIQKMTFAIDRACNPVIFVATSKGLQHDVELEPTSSIVTTNRGLTALEQSKTWSHPFLTRRPYDDLEWSTLLHERDSNHDYDDVHVRPRLSVSKDVYAVELEYYSGIWAIKGDRIEGISAHILLESLTSPLGHVSMKRSVVEWGQWRGHLVWDVSFTDPPVEEESW